MTELYHFLESLGVIPGQYLYENECLYPLVQAKEADEYTKCAKKDVFVNAFVVRERYSLCRDVFDALSDMRYVVWKGAVLSQSAYGNIAFRKSGDIDILVRQCDTDEIRSRLKTLGFVQGSSENDVLTPLSRSKLVFYAASTHQLAPFLRPASGAVNKIINIDVNFNFMWGESGKCIDLGSFSDEMCVGELCGVSFKQLSPIAEFIAVCLHHYKDMNSVFLLFRRGFPVRYLCDIYYFLVRHPEITPQKLFEKTKKHEITEYVYCCIAYANAFWRDGRLSAYLEALESGRARELFLSFGLNDAERREWTIPFERRILKNELHEYLCNTLSAEDKNKIEINTLMMH